MTALRTVASKALEALEAYRNDTHDIDGGAHPPDWKDHVEAELRAALTTPADQPAKDLAAAYEHGWRAGQRAGLDERQPAIRYENLIDFAEKHELDFHRLCSAVRQAVVYESTQVMPEFDIERLKINVVEPAPEREVDIEQLRMKEPEPEPELGTIDEVLRLTGLSYTTTYRYSLTGGFPRPAHKIGRHALWNLVEVRRWVAQKLKAEKTLGKTRKLAGLLAKHTPQTAIAWRYRLEANHDWHLTDQRLKPDQLDKVVDVVPLFAVDRR